MKSVFVAALLILSSVNALAEMQPIQNSASLRALESECRAAEESFPDFACLRFEIFQSDRHHLDMDLAELVDINEYNLRSTSWDVMREYLLSSMQNQIDRHKDFANLEPLHRLKDKNYWELLQIKKQLSDIQFDPHTYWYPSVDAVSFVSVNRSTFQIIVITHGERN